MRRRGPFDSEVRHPHTHAVDTDCRENCILLLFEPRPQERGDNSGGVSHRIIIIITIFSR